MPLYHIDGDTYFKLLSIGLECPVDIIPWKFTSFKHLIVMFIFWLLYLTSNSSSMLLMFFQAFDALLTSLETRGIRESHLHMMLQKIEVPFRERVRSTISNADSMVQHRNTTGNEATEASISPACYANVDSPNSMVCNINFEGCEYSSSFKIELGRNEVEKGSALRKYQDFQIWMWKEFFGSSNLCSVEFRKKRCSPLLGICDACLDSYLFEEGLCPSCHRAFGKADGIINFLEPSINVDRIKVDSKDLIVSSPPRIRMIKALLSMLEVSVLKFHPYNSCLFRDLFIPDSNLYGSAF